jgi:hypothetical protein
MSRTTKIKSYGRPSGDWRELEAVGIHLCHQRLFCQTGHSALSGVVASAAMLGRPCATLEARLDLPAFDRAKPVNRPSDSRCGQRQDAALARRVACPTPIFPNMGCGTGLDRRPSDNRSGTGTGETSNTFGPNNYEFPA